MGKRKKKSVAVSGGQQESSSSSGVASGSGEEESGNQQPRSPTTRETAPAQDAAAVAQTQSSEPVSSGTFTGEDGNVYYYEAAEGAQGGEWAEDGTAYYQDANYYYDEDGTAYGQSKLANILFTDALQARMDKAKIPIIANSVHPGCVMTDVSRNMHWIMRYGEKMALPLLAMIRKTPAEGAYCSVYAATAPEIEKKKIRGAYLFHCRPHTKGPGAMPVDAERLWAVSEEYVKEKFSY